MADEDQASQAVADSDSGADTATTSPVEEQTADSQPSAEVSKREDTSESGQEGSTLEPETEVDEKDSKKPRRPDKRQRSIDRLTTTNSQLLEEKRQLESQLKELGINSNQSPENVQKDLVAELGLEPGRDYTREELNQAIQTGIDERVAKGSEVVQSQVQLEVQRQLAERDRASALESDVLSVRKEYGELNPEDKSNYDPELDALVADAYTHARATNPDVRLKDIVNRQISVLRKQAERRTADAQESMANNQDNLKPTSGESGGNVDPGNLSASEYANKQGLKVVE